MFSSSSAVLLSFSTRLPGRLKAAKMVRYVSGYVRLMRLAEEAKQDDRKCRELLPKARFLLFGGEGGDEPLLMRPSVCGPERVLATSTYEGLLTEYGLEPSIVESGSVFLNFEAISDDPRFAIGISVADLTSTEFCKPRVAAFILRADDANLVSHAISMLEWHRTFKYCPRCGQETRRNAAGTQRRCVSCERVHYPQLSSVAITLLTNPDGDRCLLVRQPQFVKGMYSAVAGYVEAGETLEEAVRREVAEEVGMDVLAQRYIASQHWSIPPGTFMLGSIATVDPQQNISLDGKELEAARWFDRTEVRDAVRRIRTDPYLRIRNEDDVIFVPPRGAIAHDLVLNFLDPQSIR